MLLLDIVLNITLKHYYFFYEILHDAEISENGVGCDTYLYVSVFECRYYLYYLYLCQEKNNVKQTAKIRFYLYRVHA